MIDHVSFSVTPQEAAACAEFYALLGFTRFEPPAGLGERSIWLGSGGFSIHLMFRDRDGAELTESGPPGAGHIALVAWPYLEVIGALESAGAVIEPRGEYWGAPRCYVRDPAGNLVELMAAAPPQ